jgi:ABC-type dipeptide/oligopeptide/nickel transport system permease component
MMTYVSKRLLQAVPVLIGVSILVFLLIHLIPGDPVLVMLQGSPNVTPELIAEVRRNLGLDVPLPQQYWSYISRVIRGDLGTSIWTGQSVWREMQGQWLSTFELTVASMATAVALGVTLGTLAAVRRGTWIDSAVMGISQLGVSVPLFWSGLILIFLFSLTLGWLPATGVGGWKRLLLPTLALATNYSAVIARMVRSSLLDVLNQDYIRTARAKGLADLRVIVRHALRNALIPAITIVGLQFGNLLGGTVVIETVFSRQGLGRLAYTAILAKDFPIVQGVVLMLVVVYVLLNVAVDLSYGLLDPRIRYR